MIVAEKIFFNGNILTQDIMQPVVSAFAIAEGKIIGVGDNDSICQMSTPSCQLIDLQNSTVLPGFNDAHIHIWKVGNLITYMLDLRGVQSIDEMQQRLSDYANKNPDLQWIQARGFNEVLFPGKRMPNKLDLDAVISDRPVCVIRTCAHQVIVNSQALATIGISNQTPATPGGEIKLMPDGSLAGHFTETALGLVMDKIPPYNVAQYRRMILAAQDECLKVGITSATDPAVMPDLLEVYKSMDRNKELKIRVNAIPIRVPDGAMRALPLPAHYNTEHLKIDTVKFFSDGGLSGKTAAMKHPYRISNDHGVLRLTKDFFKQLALEAQENNFRIATHAIGDAAIDMVLEVYQEISSRNSNQIRHRIEHLGLPSAANLEMMHQLKVSAVMQPIFIYELGKNFRQYLSDEYLGRVYPARSVLNHQINLSLSTDAPVVKDFNPVTGLRAATDRKDSDGNAIAENEKISIQEAIYGYTMGSATANGDEQNRGSISPGKHADFILFDNNLAKLSQQEITPCKLLATYIAGNLVYSA
ncbi:MAG: amidohydrolase [Chitinophagales bacterium]